MVVDHEGKSSGYYGKASGNQSSGYGKASGQVIKCYTRPSEENYMILTAGDLV